MAEENQSDSQDFINVAVRVRPPDLSVDPRGGGCLNVEENRIKTKTTRTNAHQHRTFTFKTVFDTDCTQQSVFSKVGKRIIEGCVDGYNGTIFAYGQTGSGKTYTMLGPSSSENVSTIDQERRGLIPRSLEFLFVLMQRKQQLVGDSMSWLVKCSFVELYHEKWYDLLEASSPQLALRESIKQGLFIQGANEQTVTTPAQAYQVLESGWSNRRCASTAMNRESSRSHAVFTVTIESLHTQNGMINRKAARLNLVDLAGSERQKDAKSDKDRLREASFINLSLTTLCRVINLLLSNSQRTRQEFVPYRDSQLTHFLRDSLGGNARTCVIANVHPSLRCIAESYSTLLFAENAGQIRNRAVVNEDVSGQNVAALQEEISRLRGRLRQMENRRRDTLTHTMRFYNQTEAEQIDEGNERLTQALKAIHTLNTNVKLSNSRAATYCDLAERREKQLMSARMVIKFRETTIKALNDAIKSSQISPEIQKALEDASSAELSSLRSLVSVGGTEANILRSELNGLREEMQTQNEWIEGEDEREALMQLVETIDTRTDALETDNREMHTLRDRVNELSESKEALEHELLAVREKQVSEKERFKSQLAEMEARHKANCARKQMLNEINRVLTPPQTKAQRRTTMFTPGTGSTEMPEHTAFTPRTSVLRRMTCHRQNETQADAEQLANADELRNEMYQIQTLNSELEEKLDEAESVRLELETNLSALRSKCDEKETDMDALRKQMAARESELCNQLAQGQMLMLNAQQQAQVSSRQTEEYKEKLSAAESKRLELADTVSDLDAQVAQLENELGLSQRELAESEAERNRLRERTDQLEVETTTLRTQAEFYNEQLQDWEDLYERVKREAAESQRTTSKGNTAALEAKLSRLESESAKKEDELSAIKSMIGASQTRESELGNELREKESELCRLESERSNAMDLVETTNQRNDALTQQIEQSNSEHKQQLNELQQQFDSLKSQLTDSESSVNSLETDLKNKDRKLDSAERRAKKADDKVSKLESKVDHLNEELHRRQTAARRRTMAVAEKEEAENLREQLENLTMQYDQQLNDEHENRHKLNSELDSLRQQNDGLLEESSKQQRTVSKFERKIKQLEQDNEKSKKRLQPALKLCNEKEKQLEIAVAERTKLEALCEQHKQTKEQTATEWAQMQENIERLTASERQIFEEKESLRSELDNLREITISNEKELTHLRLQLNAEMNKSSKLAGHQNLKQKIHHVEQLKNDLKKSNEENEKLRKALTKAGQKLPRSRTGSELSLNDKENVSYSSNK